MLLFILRANILKDNDAAFFAGVLLFPGLLATLLLSMKQVLVYPDRLVIIRFLGIKMDQFYWTEIRFAGIEPIVKHEPSNLVLEMKNGKKVRLNKWSVDNFEWLYELVKEQIMKSGSSQKK